MNTVEGSFLRPTQLPNTQQPVNAVQFENVKFPPAAPPVLLLPPKCFTSHRVLTAIIL